MLEYSLCEWVVNWLRQQEGVLFPGIWDDMNWWFDNSVHKKKILNVLNPNSVSEEKLWTKRLYGDYQQIIAYSDEASRQIIIMLV